MLEFAKILLRSKPEYSDISIAVIEASTNNKEDAIRPLPMKYEEQKHAELVVATIKELCPNAKIYLLPPNIESVKFIVRNKIPIVNMSLTSSGLGPIEEQYLAKKAFLVTSGGNQGDKGETYAARQEWWCAVGAVDKSRELQEYSSYGLGHIRTVSYTGEKVNGITFHGTSASAPLVTSLLAQWFTYYKIELGRYPTVNEVYKFIEINSEDLGDVGKDNKYGFGLLTLPKKFSQDDLIQDLEKRKNTLKDIFINVFYYLKNKGGLQ